MQVMIVQTSRLSKGIVLGLIVLVSLTGCATKGRTGALAGGGIGAVIGQAAGRSSEATLIGAAVGSGIGYIIGNEKDKEDAAQMSKKDGARMDNGPLSGTVWQVVNLVGKKTPEFKTMVVEFNQFGRVISTKTDINDKLVRTDERFRVVGSTLIVNKPGYLINAQFRIDDDELIIDAPDFRAVLRRL